MKVIAFYLPQFYTFPENDKWWGKGFTEWTNVKKAKPLYSGHYQPNIPLDNNYYCLENREVFEWQITLAKKYGIYGFCFYHYWMGEGRQLMQKPVETYLKNPELDFPFCLSWANHNWARTWTGGDTDILMDVRYGGKDEWEAHFKYLLPYFKDRRYIREDGRPLLVLYQPEKIPCLDEMLEYLSLRAAEEGLNGLKIISQAQTYLLTEHSNSEYVEGSVLYEPDYTKAEYMKDRKGCICKNIIKDPSFVFNMVCQDVKKKINAATQGKIKQLHLTKYSYDGIWKMILNRKAKCGIYPCAFVNYDASPRKGYNSTIVVGFTPEKFGKYFSKLVKKTETEYKSDIMFLMAWNEWGEGAYVEPDERYGYAVLEQIKKALCD